MVLASSARRLSCWVHRQRPRSPAAAVVTVVAEVAVSVAVAFVAAAFAAEDSVSAITPIMAMADTGPITATRAFATRFGSGSRPVTAGEFAGARSASDMGKPKARGARLQAFCRAG